MLVHMFKRCSELEETKKQMSELVELQLTQVDAAAARAAADRTANRKFEIAAAAALKTACRLTDHA